MKAIRQPTKRVMALAAAGLLIAVAIGLAATYPGGAFGEPDGSPASSGARAMDQSIGASGSSDNSEMAVADMPPAPERDSEEERQPDRASEIVDCALARLFPDAGYVCQTEGASTPIDPNPIQLPTTLGSSDSLPVGPSPSSSHLDDAYSELQGLYETAISALCDEIGVLEEIPDHEVYCQPEIYDDDGELVDYRDQDEEGWQPATTVLDRDEDENADAWLIQITCTDPGAPADSPECSTLAHNQMGPRYIQTDLFWGPAHTNNAMILHPNTLDATIGGVDITTEDETLLIETYFAENKETKLFARFIVNPMAENNEEVVFQLLDENEPDPKSSNRYIYNVGWHSPVDLGWIVLSNPMDLDGDGSANTFESLSSPPSNPVNKFSTPDHHDFDPADPCAVAGDPDADTCRLPFESVDVSYTLTNGPELQPDYPLTFWDDVTITYDAGLVPATERFDHEKETYDYYEFLITRSNQNPLTETSGNTDVICTEDTPFDLTGKTTFEFSCGGSTNEERNREGLLWLRICQEGDTQDRCGFRLVQDVDLTLPSTEDVPDKISGIVGERIDGGVQIWTWNLPDMEVTKYEEITEEDRERDGWISGIVNITVEGFHPHHEIDEITVKPKSYSCCSSGSTRHVTSGPTYSWPVPTTIDEDNKALTVLEIDQEAGVFNFSHDTVHYLNWRDLSSQKQEDGPSDFDGQRLDVKVFTAAGNVEEDDTYRPSGSYIKVFHNAPPVLSAPDVNVLGPASPSDPEVPVEFEFHYSDPDMTTPSVLALELFAEDEGFESDPETTVDLMGDCSTPSAFLPVPLLFGTPDPADTTWTCEWDGTNETGDWLAGDFLWKVTATDADGGDNTGSAEGSSFNLADHTPELINGGHEVQPRVPFASEGEEIEFTVRYTDEMFAPSYVNLVLVNHTGDEPEEETVEMGLCDVQSSLMHNANPDPTAADYCYTRTFAPDQEFEYRFEAANVRESGDELVDDAYHFIVASVCDQCTSHNEALDATSQGFETFVSNFNDLAIPSAWRPNEAYPDQDGDLNPDLTEDYILKSEVFDTRDGTIHLLDEWNVTLYRPSTTFGVTEYPVFMFSANEGEDVASLLLCNGDEMDDCYVRSFNLEEIRYETTQTGFWLEASSTLQEEEKFFLSVDSHEVGSETQPVLSVGVRHGSNWVTAEVTTNPVNVVMESNNNNLNRDLNGELGDGSPRLGFNEDEDGQGQFWVDIDGDGEEDFATPFPPAGIPDPEDLPGPDDLPDPNDYIPQDLPGEGEVMDFVPEELNCAGHDTVLGWLNQMIANPFCGEDPDLPGEDTAMDLVPPELNCAGHDTVLGWVNQMIASPFCGEDPELPIP